MKPEAQRIAIAEACGWRAKDGVHWYPPGLHPAQNVIGYHLPDYLDDLNAMHEAEKMLKWEDRKRYHTALADVAGFSYSEADTEEETQLDWNCRICHATAAQRAEAFLRTLNLWDDSK